MSQKRKPLQDQIQIKKKQKQEQEIFPQGPPGARVQNPYSTPSNIQITKGRPIFKFELEKKINEETIKQQKKEDAKEQKYLNEMNIDKNKNNEIDETINILFDFAPKKFVELLGLNVDTEETQEGQENMGDDDDVDDADDVIKDKRTKTLAIRNFLEPVSASNQCEKSGVVFKNGTVCWLCGCYIKKEERKACEHIIPLLRATMLKGLITNEFVKKNVFSKTSDPDVLSNVTTDNYLWAHDDCNGGSGKTNLVLITYDKDSNRFVPDDAKCAYLTSKILKLPNRNCYNYGINYDGTGEVHSPYEAYIKEMEYQCKSLNEEFKYFNNSLPSFCEYALNRAKLYLTKDGLDKLLTPEQHKLKQEELEKEKKEKLENKIKESAEFYELLKKDAELKLSYLNEYQNLIKEEAKATSSEFSEEYKMAYYEIAVMKYIHYLDLLSPSDDITLKDAIMNRIQNENVKKIFLTLPIELALTLIYAITLTQLFYTDYKRTIKTDEYLNKNIRVNVQKFFKLKRKTKDVEYIKEYIYINDDNTRDDNSFKERLCEIISFFYKQYISYQFKTRSHEIKDEVNQYVSNVVVDVNTPITNDELKRITNINSNYLPYKIKYFWDELFQKTSIPKGIQIIFGSFEFDINQICSETIFKNVQKYFTEKPLDTTDYSKENVEIDIDEVEEKEGVDVDQEKFEPVPELLTEQNILNNRINRIIKNHGILNITDNGNVIDLSKINTRTLNLEQIQQLHDLINKNLRIFGGIKKNIKKINNTKKINIKKRNKMIKRNKTMKKHRKRSHNK